MEILKPQIKKYAFLLVGIYLIANALSFAIVSMYPHILEIHYSPFNYRLFSTSDLIFLIEIICNPAIALLMYRDMKKSGTTCWPILLLAFIKPVYAVVLYLIVAFERVINFKNNRL